MRGMVDKVSAMFGKVGRLFSRYPDEPGVQPQSFVGMSTTFPAGASDSLLSFQSVPDKFYFLLFGAIRVRLEAHAIVRTELVVVRAVNGAIGTGWLAELKRSAVIAWLFTTPWIRAYGKLVDGVAYRCATWRHPLLDFRDWVRSKSLWNQLKKQRESLSLKVEGIEVADLLVDSYMRFAPSPRFNVDDPFVRRLVWQALRDVRQAQEYFGKLKPRWYLTSYTTYLEHGIPARVALKNGVLVWSFGSLNSFAKSLTETDTFHTLNFSRYRSEFAALDQQDERLEMARQQLEHRLSGGIDSATSYMRKSAYSQTQVDLPQGLEGAVVIFLHDFYDSPHVYPDLVFDDFWRWVCSTVDTLKKAGALFFLKPHPNQIALSDEAITRLRYKYPDLHWLPATVSNLQLVQSGITCGVTVYGTVAHELAYLGVPSICCARHPHYTFDFCRTARTKHEYEAMLKTYWEKPLTREEMRRQALAFYYMHNLHEAGDARVLQKAFVDFWRVCHSTETNEDLVMQVFDSLVRLPAFDRFVQGMASTKGESV